ncbi:tyrosine-type recombinase/integrase [Thermodesulfovibrio hydrogeniphilus]
MLSDLKIKALKPQEKPYKVYDEHGLYLYVSPTGVKSWRIDYKFNGKRKTATLGQYPMVGVKEAREKLMEFKRMLAEGKDPVKIKKQVQSFLFKDIAERWFQVNSPGWKEKHRKTIMYRLKCYILPALGDKNIQDITKPEIILLLEKIKLAGKIETAKRVYRIINSILSYAMDLELVDKIPTLKLKYYLPATTTNHYPSIFNPEEISKLLKKIEVYPNIVVRNALKFLILTFVRPGELRLAKWNEFNLNECIWDIPAERMKLKKPHRVFLSKQALQILDEMIKLPSYNKDGYVFYGRYPDKPLSENTLNKALRIMGYNTKKDITAHGFRAMARTLIHEKLNYPPEVIEHQLAHKVPDTLGEAYNRTKFYDQRKQMMQDWADWLDSLKK